MNAAQMRMYNLLKWEKTETYVAKSHLLQKPYHMLLPKDCKGERTKWYLVSTDGKKAYVLDTEKAVYPCDVGLAYCRRRRITSEKVLDVFRAVLVRDLLCGK